jgi:hypothetical protein
MFCSSAKALNPLPKGEGIRKSFSADLFGALAMQQWGIKPNPRDEKLDLSNYPDEFIEF